MGHNVTDCWAKDSNTGKIPKWWGEGKEKGLSTKDEECEVGKEYLLVAHKIEECSLGFNDGSMDGLNAKSSENELAHKGTCW
eukprot:13848634-Ditylum_brightwellii.AAC.1